MSAANENPTELEVAPAHLQLADTLEHDTASVLQVSTGYEVTTQDEFESAGKSMTALSEREKVVHDEFDSLVADAHKVHKGLTSLRKRLLDPILERKSLYADGMAEFVKLEEARIAEEERVSRQQAEAAEAKRVAAEEKAERKAQAAEDRALEKAQALANEGKHEQAEAVIAKATAPKVEAYVEPAPAPAPIREAPRAKGVRVGKKWTMEILDPKSVIQAWLDGKLPADCVTINQNAMNKLAASMKEATNIPGCNAVSAAKVSRG